jgi:L-iditol 2-dehydrogenase
MRVAELVGLRDFRLSEHPDAEPKPGEIRVRVTSVGICGSDIHYYAEGGIGDTSSVYPMVLGHEPAGMVDKPGSGVTGWTKGDCAILEPALYCYHCEFCLTGRHNLCANLRFLSSPEDPGFFRDFVYLPAHNLLPVPPGLGLREGTLAEPLAVVLHSLRFAALRPGETAAVFGAGPIGLLTVAMLKLAGARRIWSVEPLAHRRELAAAAGAHSVIDPSAADPARQILADSGQRGADVVIDCAAKAETINQCMRAAANGARMVITGIPSSIRVDLELHVMRRKELALYNVRRSNHETADAVRLLAQYPAIFGPLVTHTRPLEQVQAAFDLVESYSDGVGKLVVEL